MSTYYLIPNTFFYIDSELQARRVSKAWSGTDISSDEEDNSIENTKLRKRTIKKNKQDQIIKKKKTDSLFTLPIPPISAVSRIAQVSDNNESTELLQLTSNSEITKDFSSKGKKHRLFLLSCMYYVLIVKVILY